MTASPQEIKTEQYDDDLIYDYFLILQLQSTKPVSTRQPKPQEVIEVSALVVNAKTYDLVDEFHRVVRPERYPTVTAECTDITGLAQAAVTVGVSFLNAWCRLRMFLDDHGLSAKNTCIVTFGRWDTCWLLGNQLQLLGKIYL